MTKLLCPLCRLTTFGVGTTHQTHTNAHLLAKHNIRITAANQAYWRQRQDTVWNDRNTKISSELREAEKRHKKNVRKAMERGELPVDHAGEEVLGALKETLARWDEVDDDDEDDNGHLVGSGRMMERSNDGIDVAVVDGGDDKGIMKERVRESRNGVSASLRHYQVAEGRVRAWQQRRELLGRMREASNREKEKSVQVARDNESEPTVEERRADDQQIEEIRATLTNALAHAKESLAQARAGKKRVLRRKVVQLMAEDAASSSRDLE